MVLFDCDYTEGAHPEIMKRLCDTNFEQTAGYGTDAHCENARMLIKKACNAPDAEVHFLVGGTQTNTTIIASILRPYQGVIACDTGHINVHETGAIEASGHKVLAVPGVEGKITASQVDEVIESHYSDATAEHMVQPGMVYISFPTEYGTLYSKEELMEISMVCRKHDVPLFIDGARMGYGLMSEENNLALADFAELADVFYIGGTKVGALFGEAVVINDKNLIKNFRYMIKQRGGMLAKGRLLGIQFETLFENDLYFEISKHAVAQAMRIRDAFDAKGVKFLKASPTNQQFPILKKSWVEQLKEKYGFEIWEQVENNADDEEQFGVRFCTSWATKAENVDMLIEDIQKLK